MEPHEEERFSARLIGANLAAILVLGVVLRVVGVAQESAWYDEVLSLKALAADSFVGFWRVLRGADPAVTLVPAYFTLEYFWSRVAGDSVLAVRILSLLFGIFALPLIYVLGRRLYNPLAGCVAALCLAMSLVHIFYAQEIRMYAMVSVLSLLSVLTLLRALDACGRRWWFVHVGVNALLLSSHLYAALQIAAEGCFLLFFYWRRRRVWLAWGIGHVLVFFAVAMWVRFLSLRGMTERAFWTPLPSVREAANLVLVLAGGRFSNENPRAYLTTGVSLDQALALLMLLLAIWLALRTFRAAHGKKDDRDAARRACALGLLGFWFLLPPLALFLLSYLHHPCFMYRYVLYSSLALYLLVGGAVGSVRRPLLRAGVTLMLVSAYAYQSLALPLPFRPDYRAAVGLVREYGSPLDCVIAFKEINALPIEYLNAAPTKQVKMIHGFRELCKEVIAAHDRDRNVWVIMWRWDDTESFEARLRENRITFVLSRLGGMPPLLVYYVLATPSDEPIVIREARRPKNPALQRCSAARYNTL